jgi:hypothetical protein
MQIQDNEGAGVGSDTFRAWIKDLSDTIIFDSGLVVLEGGKLQVLKP